MIAVLAVAINPLSAEVVGGLADIMLAARTNRASRVRVLLIVLFSLYWKRKEDLSQVWLGDTSLTFERSSFA